MINDNQAVILYIALSEQYTETHDAMPGKYASWKVLVQYNK